MPAPPQQPAKVIVIGSGMSGLAAARELQQRRYDVLVVEARSRVGGRVWGAPVETVSTDENDECVVDLGGALIHGTTGNPLSQLCVQLGVATTDNLSDSLLLDENGWPVDPKQDEKVSQLFNEALDKTFDQIARRKEVKNGSKRQRLSTTLDASVENDQQDDMTDNFGHLFDKIALEQYGSSVVDSALWTWHQANLELSCGASFEKLGYTWNDDEAYGYEGAHVSLRHSWRVVLEALVEPLQVVYDCPVAGIEIVEDGKPAAPEVPPSLPQQQQPTSSPSRKSRRLQGEEANTRRSSRTSRQTQSFTVASHSNLSYDDASLQHPEKRKQKQPPKVRVTLQNGSILQADAIVCTIPLGVLKTDTIQFTLPLPDRKKEAIANLGCGLLNKCILSFPQVFWQASDFLGLAGEETPFLILNGHKITGKPILIFMFGGESAFDVDEDWQDKDLVEECMSVLRKVSKTPPPPPLDYIVTRWGQDPYARMCFSYVPPNVDGSEALTALGEPLLSSEGRPMVLFAGEHTTPFHPSTIHGAFLSGIREACRLDLTLETRLNNGFAFDPYNLYQKTFALKKKKDDPTPSQAVLDWAKSRSRTEEDDDGHRRRHVVMTLRKKKGPSAAALLSPSRQSARKGPVEQEMEPSRKSQRKSKSPMHFSINDDNEDETQEPKQNSYHATVSQDERTLQRLIHQYPNWQVISSKVLPLYNSTKKTMALKHRYQQLRQSVHKRIDKSILVDWKVGHIKPKSVFELEASSGTRKSTRKAAPQLVPDL